jgi:hypothetical protein
VLERAFTALEARQVGACTAANLPAYVAEVDTALAGVRDELRPLAAGRAYEVFVARMRRYLERRLGEEAKREPRFVPASFEHRFADGAIVAGVELTGTADRIDRSPDGRFVVAIDYKRSGARFDDQKQFRLQLPLYAQMAANDLGAEPAGGFYVALTSAQIDGRVRNDAEPYAAGKPGWRMEPAAWQQLVDEARADAERAVAGIRDGRLIPVPANPTCPRWCGHRLVWR